MVHFYSSYYFTKLPSVWKPKALEISVSDSYPDTAAHKSTDTNALLTNLTGHVSLHNMS